MVSESRHHGRRRLGLVKRSPSLRVQIPVADHAENQIAAFSSLGLNYPLLLKATKDYLI